MKLPVFVSCVFLFIIAWGAVGICQYSLSLSPVDMNITVDPRTDVVVGNTVTFWCNAESPSVANITSYMWQNSRGVVTPDDSRISIELRNASYSSYYGAFIFNSSLTFSPLVPSDGDRYECVLTISLPDVGVNITNTTSTDIRILGLWNESTFM